MRGTGRFQWNRSARAPGAFPGSAPRRAYTSTRATPGSQAPDSVSQRPGAARSDSACAAACSAARRSRLARPPSSDQPPGEVQRRRVQAVCLGWGRRGMSRQRIDRPIHRFSSVPMPWHGTHARGAPDDRRASRHVDARASASQRTARRLVATTQRGLGHAGGPRFARARFIGDEASSLPYRG